MIRTVLIVGIVGAAVALSGCTEVLKQDQVTDTLRASYKEKIGSDLTSLDCDEDIEAKTGQKFDCRGKLENGIKVELAAEVGKKDEDSGKYDLNWKITRSIVPGSSFDPVVGKTITEQLGMETSKVKCPDGIELKAGNKVTCDVTATDGSSHEALVTLTDANGGFRVKIK